MLVLIFILLIFIVPFILLYPKRVRYVDEITKEHVNSFNKFLEENKFSLGKNTLNLTIKGGETCGETYRTPVIITKEHLNG
jgi:hypothetical protein